MGSQFLDGILSILGRITDVVALGELDLRETLGERIHDVPGVVDGERRLGDTTESIRRANLESGHIFDRFDEVHRFGRLTHRALDLDMSLVADHDEFESDPNHSPNFVVDFRDERAGCVDGFQLPGLCAVSNRGGNPVCRVDQHGPTGGIVRIFDENRAFVAQAVHDMAVVNDLVSDIDGPCLLLECEFDDLDRPVDTRTETPRTGKQDSHGRGDSSVLLRGSGHFAKARYNPLS